MLTRRDLFVRVSALTTALLGGVSLRASPAPAIASRSLFASSPRTAQMWAKGFEAEALRKVSYENFIGKDNPYLWKNVGKPRLVIVDHSLSTERSSDG